MLHRLSIRFSVATVTIALLYSLAQPAGCDAGSDPWTASQLISTETMYNLLADTKSPKPVIIYVGFEVLYKAGHIEGSRYYGAAGKPQGLAELKKQVQSHPRNKEIVLYCGCCPWDDCPNIRPAFQALKDMGFKRIKVVNIPTNLATDWAAKGYPLEKGM